MTVPPDPASTTLFNGTAPGLLPAPGTLDASGTVLVDAPCRKCSYNLRGLNHGGRCPECGTPVGASIYGEFLRYSHPGFVTTLHRAVKSIIGGIVALVLAVIVFMFWAFSQPMRSTGPTMGWIFMLLIPGLLALGGYGLILVGSWLLTTPDPSGIGEDKYGTARKIVRISLLVGIANIPLQAIAGFLPPEIHAVVGAIEAAVGLLGVVAMVAQLYYLRMLAMRIPDHALAARAGFLMWALGLSFGIMQCLAFVVQLLGPGGVATLGCMTGLAAVAVLIFGIMYLLMIEKLGKRFKEQAELARQAWTAAGL